MQLIYPPQSKIKMCIQSEEICNEAKLSCDEFVCQNATES